MNHLNKAILKERLIKCLAGKGWVTKAQLGRDLGTTGGCFVTPASTKVFKELELPFRILEICSGDLGDLKYRQVDIEVYSPRQKNYFEVTSCSNLTEAQSRRLNIKVNNGKEKYFPHTLNNTAIATSRALVAILENHQNADGSVNIPKILQKYMNGKKKIEKVK